MARKRFIRKSVDVRIAEKKAELARLLAAEKQISLSKAYNEITFKTRCAMHNDGLAVFK